MRKKNVVQSLHIQSEGATSQNKLENKLRFKKTGKTETVGIPKAFNPVCTELDSGKLFSEDKKMISESVFFFSEFVSRFLHRLHPTKKRTPARSVLSQVYSTTSFIQQVFPPASILIMYMPSNPSRLILFCPATLSSKTSLPCISNNLNVPSPLIST